MHAFWNAAVTSPRHSRAVLYMAPGRQQTTFDAAREERDLRAVSVRHGWEIVDTFVETELLGRAVRARLLRAMEVNEAGILVVRSVLALSDSLVDFVRVADQLRLNSSRLVFVEDDLDTGLGRGLHLLPALPILAQIVTAFKADAAFAGAEKGRAEGRRLGRPPRDSDRKRDAELLLRDGMGVNQVARALSMSKSKVSRIKAGINSALNEPPPRRGE